MQTIDAQFTVNVEGWEEAAIRLLAKEHLVLTMLFHPTHVGSGVLYGDCRYMPDLKAAGTRDSRWHGHHKSTEKEK